MTTSDYHFDLLLRQHHSELVREAADRALARSIKQQRGSVVAAWWHRVVARIAQRRPSAGPRPVRLHTVRP